MKYIFALLAVSLIFVVYVSAAYCAKKEQGWVAKPSVVEEFSRRKKLSNFDEDKVPLYKLPDPLIALDGQRISSSEDWTSKRRDEILELFRSHVYGLSPGKPAEMSFEVFDLDRNALGGKAIRKQVRVSFGRDEDAPNMDILIYLPNSIKGPTPVFVGFNFNGNHSINSDANIALVRSWVKSSKENGVVDNRATEKSRGSSASRWPIEAIISRGYGVATIYYGDIDPDFEDGFANGVHGYFDKYEAGKRPDEAWGAIAAWGWGLSRAMDYFESDDEIDHERIAVMGHSRLGKTSLWAGAQDERFAIVISNCSGCGGAALSRRRYGETVGRITTSFPHWFCEKFSQYKDREEELPIDQHMLISLIAPRPVYIASAGEDLWADPRGEFLSAKGADPVYRLLTGCGLEAEEMPGLNRPSHGVIGHHIRSGKHDVTEYDWEQYMDFADKYLAEK